MTKLQLTLLLASVLALSCGSSGPVPRAEHPRPGFERSDWLNLNGEWEFRFDPQEKGLDEGWAKKPVPFDQRITVPFCWESKLSGVADTSGQQIGWYRRKISVPAAWSGQHVWLRFQAVDWEARAWIDGVPVGRHSGGYTPFAFDITDHVAPGKSATLVVRAYDTTDRELPTGKQIASWYTFTSGIWQTVWLEARPDTWLETLELTPRRDGDNWSLLVRGGVSGENGTVQVKISSPDTTVSGTEEEVVLADGAGVFESELPVSDPKLWTPETPHLYDLSIDITVPGAGADHVKSYFGLRTIERGRYGDLPWESVLLNGKPVYLRGALDQSFNPGGIYTAPSDEFLRHDMELAKSFGLNFLRIHIKPDEPRRLYWADKLGVLIMQDMPNTWAYSARARKAWESTMRGVIARDRNHPAIIAWCLFNETWGIGGNEYKNRPDIQQWVESVWREAKQSDPSRLIEDNSANRRDHVITDLNSWHFYIDNEERARQHIEEVVNQTFPGSPFNYAPGHKQDTAPLINSEYGAVSAGGGDRDISWGFRYLTTRLRRYGKIQGYIYTELTDVEFEHNGFANYDRSPKQYGYDFWVKDMSVADLQGEDFVGFDTPPAIVAEPGAQLRIPVFVSHWSDVQGEVMLKRWLTGVDDLGREVRVDLDSRPVTWRRYHVTDQPPLEVTLPDRPFTGAMAMELRDEKDHKLAANFVNVVIRPPAWKGSQQNELIDARRFAMRVDARNVSLARWKGSGAKTRYLRRTGFDKVSIRGAGAVEYRFRVPQEVIDANPIQLGFLAEVATCARDEKLDWPQQITAMDYPQSDNKKLPGTLDIYVNGHPFEPMPLVDDPADARGVLSHMAKIQPGSFGYLVKTHIYLQGLPTFVPRLRRNPEIRVVLEAPDAEDAAGLNIYGGFSGRYPLYPTLILETERDINLP